eukprot:3784-Heterococcus_DN1.PRE.2
MAVVSDASSLRVSCAAAVVCCAYMQHLPAKSSSAPTATATLLYAIGFEPVTSDTASCVYALPNVQLQRQHSLSARAESMYH